VWPCFAVSSGQEQFVVVEETSKAAIFCYKIIMGKKQSKGQQGDSFMIQNFSKMANLENLTLVWCDNSSNDNNQSYERQVQEIGLRRAINFLRKFTQVDECEAFIREIDKEKVYND
jgi:hypothetical protein